jgi:hypothetical protein
MHIPLGASSTSYVCPDLVNTNVSMYVNTIYSLTNILKHAKDLIFNNYFIIIKLVNNNKIKTCNLSNNKLIHYYAQLYDIL